MMDAWMAGWLGGGTDGWIAWLIACLLGCAFVSLSVSRTLTCYRLGCFSGATFSEAGSISNIRTHGARYWRSEKLVSQPISCWRL